MKILALRGENLASLEHFDIPFDAPPLSESGLCSIDGPTGAGKSTLLDTICLALFDRVPRLVGARDAAEALQDGLSPTDPRSVLRRGAGAGMAEVDFRGRDGERYRATWEVWRARKAPDGRLQNQRVRLLRLDANEDLTGKHRTETLGAIQERVGLDFDQFRRAVLLAQGDFSAFLRARPEERAQLLERMTGTEAFSHISIAAFSRHKSDEERVSALEGQRAGTRPLRPEARSELEARAASQEATLKTLQGRRDELRQRLEQLRRRGELVEELEAAEQATAQSEAAWEAAAELRAGLEREAQIGPLRGPWEALQTSLREIERASQDRAEAQATEQRASQVRHEAEDATRTSMERQAALIEEAANLAPELEKASGLDARRRAAESEEQEAEGALDELRAELRAAVDQTEALGRAARELEGDLVRVTRSIEPEARKLSSVWSTLERELRRWVEALAERDRTLATIEAHAQEERTKEAKLSAENEALGINAEALDGARRALESARRALAEHRATGGPHRLSEAFGGLSKLSSELLELRRRMELAKQDRSAIRRLEREREKAQTKLRKARAEARRATRSRRQKEAELQELEQRFSLSRLRQQLHEHRSALLEPDAPCPLCGSAHRGDAPPHESPEAAELRRLEKLRKQIQKLEAKRTDKEIEDKTATERVAELERSIREREERAESAHAAWLGFRRSLEMVWVDSAFLAQQKVQTFALRLGRTPQGKQLSEVEDQLAETARRLQAHGSEDEARAAQVEGRERDEARARAQMTGAEERRDGLVRDLEAHVVTGKLLRQKADTLVGTSFAERVRELCPSELADPASAEPARFLAEWDARMDEVQALLEHEAQQEKLLTELRERLGSARAATWRVHARFEEARARRDRARAAREHTGAERAALLDGRGTREVQQALEARRRAGERGLATAREAVAASIAEEAAARSRIAALDEALTRTEAQRASTQTRVEAEAEGAGLAVDELAALLARPFEPEAKARVGALAEARQAARLALSDRRQRLSNFDARHPPEPAPETLAQALAEVEGELEGLTQAQLQSKTALAQDDEARRQDQALLAELEEAEARRLLSADLTELIGSADGRKFRTFAQGLSLSALLSQANLHLHRLRPRYRLSRAPGRDIDIQVVDRDLGDEVRSVSTLSGGESFLVSLALALGLSSLSARDLAVESLFIDEGFGHLDKDSLEVAISTLDALQAEGRSIAIVSHVPDVAERIGYGIEVRPLEPGRSRVRIRGA
ncbi:MAG: AAA family ATPase [Myxococcota bacterium]